MEKITEEMVWHWLGADSLKSYELVSIIHELATGEYPVSVLQNDIISTCEIWMTMSDKEYRAWVDSLFPVLIPKGMKTCPECNGKVR